MKNAVEGCARDQFQNYPNIHLQNQNFVLKNIYARNVYFNPSNQREALNSSPFHPGCSSSPRSFNNLARNTRQWTVQTNQSYSSDNHPPSYNGNASQSPHNSLLSNSGFSPRYNPYRSTQYNVTFPNNHTMHNSSAFHQGDRGSPRSISNSTGSPQQFIFRTNQSFSAENPSSSYHSGVSELSPYKSAHGNSGRPYHNQNRNKCFQEKQNFYSRRTNYSNPGHSNDIRDYVHPSMLEDPWKDLIAEMKKN